MAKHAYHDHLTAIPLFAGLDDDQLDVVAHAATQLDYQAGKVLMREGEIAHEMFVVVQGTLEVTREGAHVADIGAGGSAGEMALLAHAHRNSTVTAKTAVSVLHIDGREFTTVLERVPAIAVKLLPIVAERVTADSDDHAN